MTIRNRLLAGGLALAFTTCGSTRAAEVVVAFGAEPVQVDPTRSSAGVDQYFTNLFYEQLLAVDPHLERVNWLAESWQVDQGDTDTVIHVTLRENVRFHNGDVLTSDDFRYAYERQSDPVSRNAGRFRYIRDLVVRDERRFDIVFDTPDGAFIPLNLALWAIPRRYFEEVGDPGVQAHPIGTGPWKFVSRKPREELVVERFEDYWNPAALPAAKRLVIKIIPEDTTRVAAFRTGGVDWIDAVPPALIEGFETLPGVRVVSLPAPNNLFLNIHATDPRSPLAERARAPGRGACGRLRRHHRVHPLRAGHPHRPSSRRARSATIPTSRPIPTTPSGRGRCSTRPGSIGASTSTATT